MVGYCIILLMILVISSSIPSLVERDKGWYDIEDEIEPRVAGNISCLSLVIMTKERNHIEAKIKARIAENARGL